MLCASSTVVAEDADIWFDADEETVDDEDDDSEDNEDLEDVGVNTLAKYFLGNISWLAKLDEAPSRASNVVVKPRAVPTEELIISWYGSTDVFIPNCGSNANGEFI